ncbi:hypothetical protein SCP_1502160 [Sparassis crispa]|uniref:Uncharacterized protein n=1 Tax=Sparassis crispa TaxID=139825 RepID=A0A401H429_9APHY|nr:hypothetical protein SCP_1502030 [Sparassis crispa]XP_027620121.1 hypothetical protein SCP_1502160 [Sparassis crispa]GBE89195.1 hypothetical protein SCP_1502030 [Sparassis crispa]GBE89208.1 hypothetical protein SCP_1502160 [Sparassis crispa]
MDVEDAAAESLSQAALDVSPLNRDVRSPKTSPLPSIMISTVSSPLSSQDRDSTRLPVQMRHYNDASFVFPHHEHGLMPSDLQARHVKEGRIEPTAGPSWVPSEAHGLHSTSPGARTGNLPSSNIENTPIEQVFQVDDEQILQQGFVEIMSIVERLSARTRLSLSNILARWTHKLSSDHIASHYDHAYQRFCQHYVNTSDAASLPAFPSSYSLFRMAQGDKVDNLLEKFNEFELVSGQGYTSTERRRDFTQCFNQLKHLAEIHSKLYGFEMAFVMAGNIPNADSDLADVFATKEARGFFEMRCGSDDNTLISHLKAHIYNNVSLGILNRAQTNKLQNHVQDATLSEPKATLTTTGPVNQQSNSKNLTKHEKIVSIKSMGRKLMEKVGITTSDLFPWKRMLEVLADAGAILVNYPEVVRLPLPTSAKKGITQLTKVEIDMLHAAMTRTRNPFDIQKYEGKLEDLQSSLVPVIYGGSPGPDSQGKTGLRLFRNGRSVNRGSRRMSDDEDAEENSGTEEGFPILEVPVAADLPVSGNDAIESIESDSDAEIDQLVSSSPPLARRTRSHSAMKVVSSSRRMNLLSGRQVNPGAAGRDAISEEPLADETSLHRPLLGTKRKREISAGDDANITQPLAPPQIGITAHNTEPSSSAQDLRMPQNEGLLANSMPSTKRPRVHFENSIADAAADHSLRHSQCTSEGNTYVTEPSSGSPLHPGNTSLTVGATHLPQPTRDNTVEATGLDDSGGADQELIEEVDQRVTSDPGSLKFMGGTPLTDRRSHDVTSIGSDLVEGKPSLMGNREAKTDHDGIKPVAGGSVMQHNTDVHASGRVMTGEAVGASRSVVSDVREAQHPPASIPPYSPVMPERAQPTLLDEASHPPTSIPPHNLVMPHAQQLWAPYAAPGNYMHSSYRQARPLPTYPERGRHDDAPAMAQYQGTMYEDGRSGGYVPYSSGAAYPAELQFQGPPYGYGPDYTTSYVSPHGYPPQSYAPYHSPMYRRYGSMPPQGLGDAPLQQGYGALHPQAGYLSPFPYKPSPSPTSFPLLSPREPLTSWPPIPPSTTGEPPTAKPRKSSLYTPEHLAMHPDELRETSTSYADKPPSFSRDDPAPPHWDAATDARNRLPVVQQ